MKPSVYRWLWWLGGIILAGFALAVGGQYLAARALKGKIETALGPNGEVGEIRLGLSAVEIVELRIKAGKEWPAKEEMSAKRVVVSPDLASLLSDSIRIDKIRIENGYVSMRRGRDGKVVVLPSLLSRPRTDQGTGGPRVVIGAIELADSALEFFDATVRQPAHRIRLEQVGARLGRMVIPELTGQTQMEIEAAVKGVRRDGKLSIKGKVEFASLESEVSARLRAVDLLAFQPYLIKATETGVKQGTLDLDIKSTVHKRRLHAPGAVTLSDLELASGGNLVGVPRATVVSMLKDKDGRISINFTLDGNLDDPRFSLNESLAGRIGSSLAGAFGVSLEGLAKGVGSAGSSAAKTVGEAVGKLFGQ